LVGSESNRRVQNTVGWKRGARKELSSEELQSCRHAEKGAQGENRRVERSRVVVGRKGGARRRREPPGKRGEQGEICRVERCRVVINGKRDRTSSVAQAEPEGRRQGPNERRVGRAPS